MMNKDEMVQARLEYTKHFFDMFEDALGPPLMFIQNIGIGLIFNQFFIPEGMAWFYAMHKAQKQHYKAMSWLTPATPPVFISIQEILEGHPTVKHITPRECIPEMLRIKDHYQFACVSNAGLIPADSMKLSTPFRFYVGGESDFLAEGLSREEALNLIVKMRDDGVENMQKWLPPLKKFMDSGVVFMIYNDKYDPNAGPDQTLASPKPKLYVISNKEKK